ncbi:RNA-guided endonuclease TnpB family protein [Hydrogenivirga sp. 128-5-R1-1]|uniref:RNA-guided endonuclease InsQ/TnpB family protein n=1 Tax=Hydrogenivirga sp. 128-5-R1-1 TaxID=392423 RepID=UPI00015F3950|nr:RNA-guided endonuclease TnpB family protein [Hydrogenivirga sp. 128-5-R1-1]EDP75091.1 probable transposase [Hydrogenivirga sp. 128-5-R1-1]
MTIIALDKKRKIKESLKKTKEKRKNQIPKVYKLKISCSNLNKEQKHWLERVFLEAKWLYNYTVADIENRLNPQTEKIKQVEVKTPQGIETRELTCLSSQMKQGIMDRIKKNLTDLSRAKRKGIKVGRLKFKSDYRNIPLKQNGITFKVLKDKNRIKLQGLKKPLRVLGLHQLPENCDIAKAELIKRPDGYYIHLTCYIDKDRIKHEKINKPIGIDFGIKHQLTLSNGVKINYRIGETQRLKRLQKKLSRQQKGSKNYQKTKHKIQREHQKIYNRRKDIKNKILSLLKRYEYVLIQEEQIKNWHSGLFGKQVQNTGIGGIISMLKQNIETLIPVDRYKATTKMCSRCGSRKEDITLSDRTYKCESCGLVIDRDFNSAVNILKIGLSKVETTTVKNLPTDCGEVTPVEREATARIFKGNPYIRVSYTSVKQEARLL